MGWFDWSSKVQPPPEDAIALRDGLVILLDGLREIVGPSRAERADRLIERLARFPPPSGLSRELKQLRSELLINVGEHRGDPDAIDPKEVSRLADAVVAGMSATALIHSALEARIQAVREGLPRRMTKAELDRIVTEINEIAESSQSIRRRTVEDRAELAGLLREMGKRLAEADAASTNLGQNITMVAESLVREPLPDELRSVRHALIARVERLNQDAGALRTQLARARDRSRHLEDMVQQQAEELIDMRTKAALDPLTNICNRGVFDKAIIALTKRAASTNSPLSLVVLDVDHFKRVNDTWGHPAGDAVLIGVARCMEEQVREGDVVARIGGEEFALVLPGANLNVARAVAERLRLSVAAANFSEPAAGVKVTASFGVAQMGPSELPKSLIRRADQAMYAAKHAGRNQVKLSEQRG